MKTAKLILDSIKDPDKFTEMCWELGLIREDDRGRDYDSVESPLVAKHFEFHEYASIEIEVDENLNIVGGRFLPIKGQ